MRSKPVRILLAILLVAGCDPPGTTPGAVQPTIDAIAALGLRCDSGLPDNVPRGLSQWQCRGSIDGMDDVAILVDGNAAGVSAIDVVSPTDDTGIARAAVSRVVGVAPPLSSLEGLALELDDALRTWDGRQTVVETRGIRVSAECLLPNQFGDGQCIIHFVGPDPLAPMLP